MPNPMEYAKACKRTDWSVAVMADVAASVLARLKDKAEAAGVSCFQNM